MASDDWRSLATCSNLSFPKIISARNDDAISFNIARMVGPAVAGVLVALMGSGWVFLVSAVSFAALLCSLSLLRVGELHLQDRALRASGNLADGFRYLWKRTDLKAVLVSHCPISRARLSDAPPAAMPTMMRTGRAG
jgi:hypothetical protein